MYILIKYHEVYCTYTCVSYQLVDNNFFSDLGSGKLGSEGDLWLDVLTRNSSKCILVDYLENIDVGGANFLSRQSPNQVLHSLGLGIFRDYGYPVG